MTSAKKAVLFDWRGTLCVTPSDLEWFQTSLRLLGSAATEDAQLLLDRLESAPGVERLAAPDVDTSARLHRDTYYSVFTEAGFEENVSDALYAVESDAKYNPFSLDVRRTMQASRALAFESPSLAISISTFAPPLLQRG